MIALCSFLFKQSKHTLEWCQQEMPELLLYLKYTLVKRMAIMFYIFAFFQQQRHRFKQFEHEISSHKQQLFAYDNRIILIYN